MFIKKHIPTTILLFFIIEVTILIYLFKTGQSFMRVTPDGELYFNIAENLANGKGMVNNVRKEYIIVPPLFSIILSPFALMGGKTAFFIFQYILYGINGVLLYIVALRCFNKISIAIISAVLYAFHPVLLLNGPQYLLTETLFITFILSIIYISIRFLIEKTKEKWLWSLVFLLTLSLLFRPHLLYVFVLIGFIWILFIFQRKIRVQSIAVFIIPIVLLLGNGFHNLYLHGEFVLLENYSGQNLYIANNPKTKVAFYASTVIEDFVEEDYFELKDLSLSERSQILKEKAMSYMISNPIKTIKRSLLKMGLFFKGIHFIDWVVLLLSILGAFFSIMLEKKIRIEILYILLFILGFAALTSLGLLVGGQRYRTPIIPVYLLFAAYALSGEWFRKWKR